MWGRGVRTGSILRSESRCSAMDCVPECAAARSGCSGRARCPAVAGDSRGAKAGDGAGGRDVGKPVCGREQKMEASMQGGARARMAGAHIMHGRQVMVGACNLFFNGCGLEFSLIYVPFAHLLCLRPGFQASQRARCGELSKLYPPRRARGAHSSSPKQTNVEKGVVCPSSMKLFRCLLRGVGSFYDLTCVLLGLLVPSAHIAAPL